MCKINKNIFACYVKEWIQFTDASDSASCLFFLSLFKWTLWYLFSIFSFVLPCICAIIKWTIPFELECVARCYTQTFFDNFRLRVLAFKGSKLGPPYPYAIAYYYLKFKLCYLKKLKLFSIWIKIYLSQVIYPYQGHALFRDMLLECVKGDGSLSHPDFQFVTSDWLSFFYTGV